jgi:hypothetical protein
MLAGTLHSIHPALLDVRVSLEKKPFGRHTITLTLKPPPSLDDLATPTKAQLQKNRLLMK